MVGSMVAGSMPGQDQVNASGAPIFARYRRPSRHRNPDRVYSARRPFRDLNRGYQAAGDCAACYPAESRVTLAAWLAARSR